MFFTHGATASSMLTLRSRHITLPADSGLPAVCSRLGVATSPYQPTVGPATSYLEHLASTLTVTGRDDGGVHVQEAILLEEPAYAWYVLCVCVYLGDLEEPGCV